MNPWSASEWILLATAAWLAFRLLQTLWRGRQLARIRALNSETQVRAYFFLSVLFLGVASCLLVYRFWPDGGDKAFLIISMTFAFFVGCVLGFVFEVFLMIQEWRIACWILRWNFATTRRLAVEGTAEQQLDALRTIRYVGDPDDDLLLTLSETLSNEQPRVRRLTLQTLAFTPNLSDSLLRRVRERLNDPDPLVRLAAHGALLQQKQPVDPAIAPQFAEQLTNMEDDFALLCCQGLVRLGPLAATAMPKLVELLLDRDAEVYPHFLPHCIQRIGSAAVPYLVELLHQNDTDVQKQVIHLLIDLGADAQAALPELHHVAQDESGYDEDIRNAALTAIQAIEEALQKMAEAKAETDDAADTSKVIDTPPKTNADTHDGPPPSARGTETLP